MKKLFKLLTLLGIAAGVVWVLRDQLLPGPQQPTAHPPAFRNPPPPPGEDAAARGPESNGDRLEAQEDLTQAQDDLTEVNGIGPVYAERLTGVGIKSFSDLAAADAEDLANRTDLPRDRVADWIRKAADLA